MSNNTTTQPSRNTARDRIRLVIKESLELAGLQFDCLVSTHFLTPGFMLFQCLIVKPADLDIHQAATMIYHAFGQDITLQSIGLRAGGYYAINLKVDVQAALAEVPTNEAIDYEDHINRREYAHLTSAEYGTDEDRS